MTNNAIAGTDAYGYWYDMQETATGPSFDPNICPIYSKLGVFRDNSAHSCQKYGLRIFHALVPRTFPCKQASYDASYISNGKTDPYWYNPVIPAKFLNFLAWKCGRNGAIAETTGAVEFIDFKIADNLLTGIEFSLIDENTMDGLAKVVGGTVVGNTYLNDDDN